jgi:4-amino-4-deoxy-L-arabinose transferase-like glycosyltransferase
MPDAPAAGLFGLGLFFLFVAERRRILFLMSGIFFALAVLMKLSIVVMVFTVPLFFLLSHRSIRSMILFGTGFGLTLLPYLLWAQYTQGFFLEPFLLGQRQVLGEAVATFYYFETLPFIVPIIMSTGLCAFLLLSWRRLKHPELFLLLISTIFLLYLTITPHKEMRYFLPGLIPLLVLSARGINLLWNKYQHRWAHFGIALLFCVPLVSTAMHVPRSFTDDAVSNEMRVSDFLSAHTSDTAVIYTNFNYPVFAYYTKRNVSRLSSEVPLTSQLSSAGVLVLYHDHPYIGLEDLVRSGKLTNVYSLEDITVYTYAPASD